MAMRACVLSYIQFFGTSWTEGRQAPLSMGLYLLRTLGVGLPFPPPEDLPNTGIKPASPALLDSLALSQHLLN